MDPKENFKEASEEKEIHRERVASVVHRQEAVDCLQKFNDRRKLKEIVYGPELDTQTEQSFLTKLEEVYASATCLILLVIIICGNSMFIFLWTMPATRILGILYMIWYFYDMETPHTGGRRLKFLRKLNFWRARRNYFPIKLVKTAELPADTTYVFSCFPHGIFAFGLTTNIFSDVNHFDEAYPGLNPLIMTTAGNFLFPIARDLFLALGLCASSEHSILKVLNGSPGNVVVLVVGGVAEALISAPDTNRLILKNRKGFIRLALKAGSAVVPVFTFGETNCYGQITGKWCRWFQLKLKSTIGLPFALLTGKGFGPYKDGYVSLLPYRRPITTVVGKPMKLPKIEDPPQELIDKYHRMYIEELTALFNKYKGKYDSNGVNASLSIE